MTTHANMAAAGSIPPPAGPGPPRLLPNQSLGSFPGLPGHPSGSLGPGGAFPSLAGYSGPSTGPGGFPSGGHDGPPQFSWPGVRAPQVWPPLSACVRRDQSLPLDASHSSDRMTFERVMPTPDSTPGHSHGTSVEAGTMSVLGADTFWKLRELFIRQQLEYRCQLHTLQWLLLQHSVLEKQVSSVGSRDISGSKDEVGKQTTTAVLGSGSGGSGEGSAGGSGARAPAAQQQAAGHDKYASNDYHPSTSDTKSGSPPDANDNNNNNNNNNNNANNANANTNRSKNNNNSPETSTGQKRAEGAAGFPTEGGHEGADAEGAASQSQSAGAHGPSVAPPQHGRALSHQTPSDKASGNKPESGKGSGNQKYLKAPNGTPDQSNGTNHGDTLPPSGGGSSSSKKRRSRTLEGSQDLERRDSGPAAKRARSVADLQQGERARVVSEPGVVAADAAAERQRPQEHEPSREKRRSEQAVRNTSAHADRADAAQKNLNNTDFDAALGNEGKHAADLQQKGNARSASLDLGPKSQAQGGLGPLMPRPPVPHFASPPQTELTRAAPAFTHLNSRAAADAQRPGGHSQGAVMPGDRATGLPWMFPGMHAGFSGGGSGSSHDAAAAAAWQLLSPLKSGAPFKFPTQPGQGVSQPGQRQHAGWPPQAGPYPGHPTPLSDFGRRESGAGAQQNGAPLFSMHDYSQPGSQQGGAASYNQQTNNYNSDIGSGVGRNPSPFVLPLSSAPQQSRSFFTGAPPLAIGSVNAGNNNGGGGGGVTSANVQRGYQNSSGRPSGSVAALDLAAFASACGPTSLGAYAPPQQPQMSWTPGRSAQQLARTPLMSGTGNPDKQTSADLEGFGAGGHGSGGLGNNDGGAAAALASKIAHLRQQREYGGAPSPLDDNLCTWLQAQLPNPFNPRTSQGPPASNWDETALLALLANPELLRQGASFREASVANISQIANLRLLHQNAMDVQQLHQTEIGTSDAAFNAAVAAADAGAAPQFRTDTTLGALVTPSGSGVAAAGGRPHAGASAGASGAARAAGGGSGDAPLPLRDNFPETCSEESNADPADREKAAGDAYGGSLPLFPMLDKSSNIAAPHRPGAATPPAAPLPVPSFWTLPSVMPRPSQQPPMPAAAAPPDLLGPHPSMPPPLQQHGQHPEQQNPLWFPSGAIPLFTNEALAAHPVSSRDTDEGGGDNNFSAH